MLDVEGQGFVWIGYEKYLAHVWYRVDCQVQMWSMVSKSHECSTKESQ